MMALASLATASSSSRSRTPACLTTESILGQTSLADYCLQGCLGRRYQSHFRAAEYCRVVYCHYFCCCTVRHFRSHCSRDARLTLIGRYLAASRNFVTFECWSDKTGSHFGDSDNRRSHLGFPRSVVFQRSCLALPRLFAGLRSDRTGLVGCSSRCWRRSGRSCLCEAKTLGHSERLPGALTAGSQQLKSITNENYSFCTK